MNALIYIHGFNSSEQSYKATLLCNKAEEQGQPHVIITPRLSYRPAEAIQQLESLIEQHEGDNLTLIGSSLGGFYAAYLAEKYRLKTILVNPAMEAPTLFTDHIGPQYNPYTKEHYELTADCMKELEQLIIPSSSEDLYWLMVQEGDEVLDYKAALKAFPQCLKLTHEKHGDHSFLGFDRYLDDIFQFAEISG